MAYRLITCRLRSLFVCVTLGNICNMKKVTAQLTSDPFENMETHNTVAIYAPAIQEFPPEMMLDLIQLPLGNLNQLTASYIASISKCDPKPSYCGVFALDPFIKWKDFLAQIRGAGFHRICNFPKLPAFGSEETDALLASGFSFQHELEVLVSFAEDGMDILVVCSDQNEIRLAEDVLTGLPVEFCLIADIGTN